MGLLDSIKGIYQSGEDLYYDVLDGINDTVPVYSIIDPIDKAFPSFALLLIAFILLVSGGLFALFGGVELFPPADTLTITVLDSKNAGIEGAKVTFSKGSEEIATLTTNAKGFATQAGFKKGDNVDVTVEKDAYLTVSRRIAINELPKTEVTQLQKESEAFTEKTITLVDDLGSPAREALTLEFRCSNTFAPSIGTKELSARDAGVAKVNVPGNCERLTVSVTDSVKYRDISGINVTGEDEVIRLQEAEPEGQTGTITVNVTDTAGTGLDNIQVNLYKYAELARDPHVGPIDSTFTSGGQAKFTKAAGDYVIKTYDSAGVYSETTSDKLRLQAGGSQVVALKLVEGIKGKIKVKVVDKASQNPVGNAKVKLVYGNNQELTTQTVNSDGEAQFSISREVEYKAIATAKDYALGTVAGLRISDTVYKVEVSRCTPTTCGSLRVKVTDQDNNPIQNATVALYNAQTNSISGHDTRPTDINGIAKFRGVSSDTYYAFAFKEGFSGRSDASSFDSAKAESAEADLIVKMEVGEGIVAVSVKDSGGSTIPFAQVSIFDARSGLLVKSDFTDNNGSKEFTLRADKKVYAVVSRKDDTSFATYTTTIKPVIPSGTQAFDVTLEKRILKDNVELLFNGLYLNGQRANTLKAGLTYTARLKLLMPEEKDYRSVGVHIRTGDDVLMEKDKLFIKEVKAPRTSQTRATRLEPEAGGFDEADYDVTAGDAKWVNLYWSGSQAGVYEIEAEVGVRDSAAIGDRLPLYYRAWGEKREGDRDRFPVDETVVKELYANTKQELFQVDTITLCDDSFCFAATITDEKEGLTESITETYNARVFNPYNLRFAITNSSDSRIHNNANLRVSNLDKVVKFFDYKLTNAETRETGGVLNGFEFPFLSVGNLGPKSSIRFDAGFTPQKAGNGIINIRLVSDQALVYNKAITVIVSSPNELDAQISPETFLSGVENDITVTVKDRANQLEVEGAMVKVKDRHGNLVDSAPTGIDGVAKVTLPGQRPGEKLKIEVEKPNYNVKVIEVQVSDKLLEIKPDQIGAGLNTKSKLVSEEKFSIRNIAPYSLTIKNIYLSGNFRNVIDTGKVRAWLENSYKGMVLKPDEKQEFTLKTYLTEDARVLAERKSFDAELTVIAGNFGQEWLFNVPVKIAVGLGEEVDNPACLIVTKSEWVTSTTGKPKYTEVQIQNNCTIAGKPVPLMDLEAKVDWKGNQIGTYSLTFNLDTDNKEGQKAELRSGYFRKLVGTIKQEQVISAILTFTPFGGVNGVANAEVTIQATNPLDAEDQVLTNKIKTTITATNLDECLSYDKERLVVKQGETGTITVTATDKCGEPVKLTLESRLRTTPKKDFTLEPGKAQAIEVFAEQSDPGQYPIYLTGKFGSDVKRQLTKNLRVIVNAPGCWQLSKYEFDVYDSPRSDLDGFDTASFSNTCVEKPVGVRVNTKDFMKALKNGIVWGVASMGLTMLTNAADPSHDWLGRPTDPVTGERVTKAQQGVAQAQRDVESTKKAYEDAQQRLADLEKKAQEKPNDAQAQKDLAAAREAARKNAEAYAVAREAAKKAELDKVVAEQEAKKLENKLFAATNPENMAQPGDTKGLGKTDYSTGEAGVPQSLVNGEYVYEAEEDNWYRYTDTGDKEKVTDRDSIDYLNATGEEIGVHGNKQAIVGQLPTSPPNTTAPTATQAAPAGQQPSTQEGEPFRKLSAEEETGQVQPGQAVLVRTTPFVVLPQGFSGGVTGYAAADTRSVATSIAGQLGGGIFANVLGGGAGLVRGLFGTSPWAAGVLGLVVGTTISYMSQAEEINFTVLQKDAELKDFAMVQGSPPNEQEDTEIRLDVEGFGTGGAPTAPQPLVNNPSLISQGSETFRLTFTNASNLITTGDKPKYKTLKAEGIRHKYKDKVYDKDDFINEQGGIADTFFTSSVLDKTRTKLEEEEPQPLEQRWSLEFNSVPPQVETPQRPDLLLNCQAGEKVGSTGKDALPKVKFAWSWSAIEEKACNEDNPNGIYCDATQFSIALLKKIHLVSEYVKSKGSEFQCPSPVEDEPAKNEIGPQDVGIESVSITKSGKKIEIIAKLTNTNPGEVGANVKVKAVKIGSQGEVQCPDGAQNLTINGGGTKEARCTFPELAEGYWQARVEITPSISCEKCGDRAATNSLSRNFFSGRSGLQQCSPYSTARLDKFLQASGITGGEAYVKMSKFRARLMADGYSNDFQRDFDLAQRQAFFRTDSYYMEQPGLGDYFREPKLFSFDAYSQPDFTLPGPGTYDVTVDINYSDNSWELFDAKGNPKAKITIRMEKLRQAEPDSPFYYLPLDGLVGDGGRTGYGVNFNGDSILVDNSPNPLRTVEIAGSSPIQDGLLTVNKAKSFKAMQVDNAGVVANLNRAQGSPQLLFQPSNATPVILQIDKKSGSDAYAVYQVGVDGDAVDVGPTLAKWNGVGILCRAFNDEILAQQQNVPDTHMISASCSVARSGDRSLYTLEFCGEPKRFGTASYETIFYTPQDSDSFIKLAGAASDSARLIGVRTKAQNIELNGNGITRKITSLQDIFDLVGEEYMCVSSTNINAEFFWNPKKIYDIINSKEEDAINACIASESSNIKAG